MQRIQPDLERIQTTEAYLLKSSNSHALCFFLHISALKPFYTTLHLHYTCARDVAFKKQPKEQELPKPLLPKSFFSHFLQRMVESISPSIIFIYQQQQYHEPEVPESSHPCFLYLILTKDHQMPPFCIKLSLLLSPVCREYSRISNKYKRCLPFNSPNSQVLCFSLYRSPSNHTARYLIFFHYTGAKNLAIKQQLKEQKRSTSLLPKSFIFSPMYDQKCQSYHLHSPTATTPRSTTIFLSVLSVQFLRKDHRMPPLCAKLSLLLSPVCREYNRISNTTDAYLLNSPNSHLLCFSFHKSPSNQSTPQFIFFQYAWAKSPAFKQQTKEQELPTSSSS